MDFLGLSDVGGKYDHIGSPMLVAILGTAMLQYLSYKVSLARQEAKIPYPNMYASEVEASKNPLAAKFNLAQTAHQNVLESYLYFLVLLGGGALKYPFVCAMLGVLYLVSTTSQALAFMGGNTRTRSYGALSNSGMMGLVYINLVVVSSYLKIQ